MVFLHKKHYIIGKMRIIWKHNWHFPSLCDIIGEAYMDAKVMRECIEK